MKNLFLLSFIFLAHLAFSQTNQKQCTSRVNGIVADTLVVYAVVGVDCQTKLITDYSKITVYDTLATIQTLLKERERANDDIRKLTILLNQQTALTKRQKDLLQGLEQMLLSQKGIKVSNN